jgi:anti-sigma regulatory factor (Ser/Thr protein kinase)
VISPGRRHQPYQARLLRLGADPQIARRCGIAVYEAEINLIIHTTNGGILKLEVESHRITMSTTDDGPGIPDIDQVLQPGYTTATERQRDGLWRRMDCQHQSPWTDDIESKVGKGTKLIMRIHVPTENFTGRKEQ